MILFPDGLKGLSDTKWQGVQGSAHRVVGIDYRSEPGLIKVQQALAKHSGATVDEFCRLALPLSDGSNLWFSSVSGQIWREINDTYTLVSTLEIPGYTFKLSTAADTGKSYNFSAQINIPLSIVFRPDGLRMYVLCNAKVSGNNGEIFQYTLTTAFDVSTANYSTPKTFTGIDVNGHGMAFNDDGTKLFISEDNGGTSVITYTLGTAWDISTCGAAGTSFNFSAQGSRGYEVDFSSDGTKMVIFDAGTYEVNQYTLGTAWDVSTAVFATTFDLPTFTGGCMSPDGMRMYVQASTSNGIITEYILSTAYDVSTAVLSGDTFEAGSGKYSALTAAPDGSGFYTATQSTESVYQYSLTDVDADLNVTVLGAEEHSISEDSGETYTKYVYFATQNWLFRIALSDIALDWNGTNPLDPLYDYVTLFANGDDTYHPMQKQNNRLYIGDKYVLAEVNEFGVVTLNSNFNVAKTERITTLIDFDTDLLVGTKDVKTCWVRRWDTESDSWYAQDELFESEVYAFLRDDNFVYVQAGDFGRMYYYDGEKLLPDTRIPGTYSPTSRCKINANATANLLGIPVFGLSNIEGNPAWQGVYSYGRYSKDYSSTLDLSFPLSANLFDNIEIGVIIVQGADMYVSWATENSFGIDKIDWAAKYESAFIESAMLIGAKDRSVFKAIKEMSAEYYKMPGETSLEFSIENNYAGFHDIEASQKVQVKLNQIQATSTRKELGAVAVMIEFNVDGNETPQVENFNLKFEGEK